ncbi:hypothetical protein [Actinomadura harenae]|uniref:WXG100 family type VII secretion target n=1 Tax=Actinomadura harenae TaxID=2483351 RepID=A0A3M2MF16_9ACTN|nr:hypothetical protein [Actinomadura harenae]RMI47473.1 hypothetical protein EBO15_02935 [Actinomadura harenae]
MTKPKPEIKPKPSGGEGKTGPDQKATDAIEKSWPSRSEQVLNTAMGVVLIYDAQRALATAKKLKGDYKAVLRAAGYWFEAADQMGSANTALFQATNNLGGFWDGPAYRSFSEYITRNGQVSDSNAAVLREGGDQLLEVTKQILAAYDKAVDFTMEASSRVEGLVGNFDPSKEDKMTITVALRDFVNNIFKTQMDLRNAIATYQISAMSLRSKIGKLTPPSHLQDAARDPQCWKFTR